MGDCRLKVLGLQISIIVCIMCCDTARCTLIVNRIIFIGSERAVYGCLHGKCGVEVHVDGMN
jgi:hypothetical protein